MGPLENLELLLELKSAEKGQRPLDGNRAAKSRCCGRTVCLVATKITNPEELELSFAH